MSIRSPFWDDIIWRGGFNQLLGIGNPSTAQTLGGEVVGGVPLLGGFYPTPTPLSPIPMSMDPTSSRTNAGARPTAPSTPTSPPSRSPVPLGTPSTQIPRTTNLPPTFSPAFPPEITNAPIAPMTPMPSLSPGESSLNFPQTPDRFKLPPAIIAGIALGSVLIVFISLLGCWLIQRRRRATLAKRRTQRDSFLHNPIISSLLVPNQSSSSFRGTPYLGEGDMFYAGPPSLCRNTSSSFGHTFRYSHGQSADPVDDSRLNEVNYLDVMQGHPRVDSLRPIKEDSSRFLHPNIEKERRFSNTYTHTNSQYVPQEAASEITDDSQSSRTRRSSFRSGFSSGSLIFPQVAKFRTVQTNEAGIPIQNLAANRVRSHIAADIIEFDDQELDAESDSDDQDSQKLDPDFPSFYLPRAGDPKQISVTRVDLPTQSLVSRTTNFSYPMPRLVPSPPEVPGPILNRPRFKYGQNNRRGEDSEVSSPLSEVNETTTRPGSTATPGFANNRYIPTKGKKRKTNANVLSILNKSSLRKSSAKSMLPKRLSACIVKRQSALMEKRQSALNAKRQSTSKRGDRKTMASVSSIDIPDPYGHSKISHEGI
ncbi:hypothetical protein MJO28_006913 [Puccinia striiformis f. sp. tritici]|uniref:Uncharacterized protein n=1 Tax=Puccinia striiformis f. sp. tritici TaxID=168172 RepID=A0ACC0ECJ3_9BASI|nr:hypothetical protein MJO28_006913 [Puccinia striiformis f. sp. tritici]